MEEGELLETWRIHRRINFFKLDAISSDAFKGSPPVKRRSLIQMSANVHNTRLIWLKSGAPELLKDLPKIGKNDTVRQALLRKSHEESAQAIETLLEKAFDSDGKVKGFKPTGNALLGHLISHKAYHYSQIGTELVRIGFPLDKKTTYGMRKGGLQWIR